MTHCNRRTFIKSGIGLLAGSMLPLNALAALSTKTQPDRTLSFSCVHTGETMRVTYFSQGAYLPDALMRINYLLRDHRTGDVTAIDPNLLDLLFSVKSNISEPAVFNVISGYRSPETNRKLRAHTSGVAKNSLHTRGRAIDIRLPGFETKRLRNLCVTLKAGGVGYYPRSDFVHVDTGRVRTW